ncbi:hypothetical protein TSUD_238510 [Trifolium subterraneum]|uniref:EF-hand domain-containing protein n=1 Tax=Trifolium subterraneum TaxID=3900 RepID=A0A2Z6PL56_TRISU|nr:hypothetical protein TSUD_238510 [Trifolium subterraneum]
MPGLSKFVNHSGEVRVVVAGDSGTGKTNLVNAASIHQVPETLASNYDGVPITIIDTSSRTEDSAIVDEQLKQADSVILTYALDRPQTFQNLTTFWLPRLRQLQVKVPVVVVCVILIGYRRHQGHMRYLPVKQVSLKQAMSPLMQQFCEIEAYIECSPFRHIQSVELTNEAIDFLKKIFEEFDGDSDKVLQPHELEKLFSTALER